jgi:alpha-aminoadipate carrier protein LysW
MITVFCIDCDRPIKLESRPTEGELILCPSCGTDLEVIGVDPVELDWAYLKPAEQRTDGRWRENVP